MINLKTILCLASLSLFALLSEFYQNQTLTHLQGDTIISPLISDNSSLPQTNIENSPIPNTFRTEANSTSSKTNPEISQAIDDLVYPGATTLDQTSKSLVMITDDTPTIVTQWYKNIFKQLGIKTQNVVETKTNGTILNLLSGFELEREISILIKTETNNIVSISINENFTSQQEI